MSRADVLEWFAAALDAVDPRELTARALAGANPDATVVAIGKAAAGMCLGAADALGGVRGICVTDTPSPVPDGIELVVGDHPIPGEASLEAGRKAIQTAAAADGRVIALVSGGGSALCEVPLSGIDPGFVAEATRALLGSGASIADTNLVRRHLSAIKGGGLARAARVPVETLLISDVSGAGPEMVASGPTLGPPGDPDAAVSVLQRHGVDVPAAVEEAIRAADLRTVTGPVTVLADGKAAAGAMANAAREAGLVARVDDQWLEGPTEECLDRVLASTGPGVLVAAGEPTVAVTGDGRGGRNTHAALLAAQWLAGKAAVFSALATDGVDGTSTSAGAVVDGETVARGGDPAAHLSRFDSASYLAACGALVVTGPTGTNVADLWLLWHR